MNMGTPAATCIHYLFQYPFTAVMAIVIIAADAAGLKKAVPTLLGFWSRTLFVTLGKSLVIQGLEHIHSNGPKVIVANHASMYDIPLLLTAFPDCAFIGRKHLLKIPVFSRLLKTINYIPIDPAALKDSFKALDSGTSALNTGVSILMFPEGTRTRTGELGTFKRGFVKIIKETGAALQPVSLNGLYTLKPKGAKTIHPKTRVSIIIHPAIPYSSLDNKSDKDIIRIAKTIVASGYAFKRQSTAADNIPSSQEQVT